MAASRGGRLVLLVLLCAALACRAGSSAQGVWGWTDRAAAASAWLPPSAHSGSPSGSGGGRSLLQAATACNTAAACGSGCVACPKPAKGGKAACVDWGGELVCSVACDAPSYVALNVPLQPECRFVNSSSLAAMRNVLLSSQAELVGDGSAEAVQSWTAANGLCLSATERDVQSSEGQFANVECDEYGGFLPQSINLLKGGLAGVLPSSWSALTSVEHIMLSLNRLRGPLPGSWSALKARLTHLSLEGNQLTGALPSSWSAMTGLTELSLGGNSLSGPLPTTWSALRQLAGFSLHSNNVSGNVPRTWGSMPSLMYISLYDNPGLRGCLPAAWRKRRFYMGADNWDVVSVGAKEDSDPVPWAKLTPGEGPLANTQVTGWCASSSAGG